MMNYVLKQVNVVFVDYGKTFGILIHRHINNPRIDLFKVASFLKHSVQY